MLICCCRCRHEDVLCVCTTNYVIILPQLIQCEFHTLSSYRLAATNEMGQLKRKATLGKLLPSNSYPISCVKVHNDLKVYSVNAIL